MITPRSSAKAIETALSQNRHLTALPHHRPKVLAPEGLTQTSGTAEILRLPEVQEIVVGDFLVLPCDIVCEVPGETLLNTWMVQQAGLGDVAAEYGDSQRAPAANGSHSGGTRGGLGVWYHTKGEGSSKQDETDFLITAPLETESTPPVAVSGPRLQRVVFSTTKDTLGEIVEEKGGLPLRTRLLETYGKLKVLNTYRDAHIYFFPHWVLEMINRNDAMDTISEDVIGRWAKTAWQPGLGEKLGLHEVLQPPRADEQQGATSSATEAGIESSRGRREQRIPVKVPPLLGYIADADPHAPLVRRVDTSSLLLAVSLRLAKLPAIGEAGRAAASPFAHAAKIAHPEGVAPRTTVSAGDCLLAEHVTVEPKCHVRETVVGAHGAVKSGGRLTRCLLMDGAVVGERSELVGCVVGRRAQVGQDCALVDCEVQDGHAVPDGTEARGEKFMAFEGLDGASGDEASEDINLVA